VECSPDKIQVIDLRFLSSNRPLKAFADIQVGDWIVREWRIIKVNGKRPLIAPPQTSWKGTDGQIQYKTIITLPDELKAMVDLTILKRFMGELENREGGK
jgi:hypothetical protein